MINIKEIARKIDNLIGQRKSIPASHSHALFAGHEEIGNLHFNLKMFFITYLSKNHTIPKSCTVNYLNMTHFPTKCCYNIYF